MFKGNEGIHRQRIMGKIELHHARHCPPMDGQEAAAG